ncbi:MAG TPA: hypothetical protein VF677_02310 [Flavobacterium sp.]|jgi:hypothetical protein
MKITGCEEYPPIDALKTIFFSSGSSSWINLTYSRSALSSMVTSYNLNIVN